MRELGEKGYGEGGRRRMQILKHEDLACHEAFRPNLVVVFVFNWEYWQNKYFSTNEENSFGITHRSQKSPLHWSGSSFFLLVQYLSFHIWGEAFAYASPRKFGKGIMSLQWTDEASRHRNILTTKLKCQYVNQTHHDHLCLEVSMWSPWG